MSKRLSACGQLRVCCRRARTHLLAFAAALTLAALLCGYYSAKLLLFKESIGARGDVIVLLGGRAENRVFAAIRLFKNGAASTILVSGYGDSEYTESLLELAGVPKAAIVVEGESRSTRENARRAVSWMRGHRVGKAVIVTSWFHSRRAWACFRSSAPEIQMYSVPAYHGPSMRDKPRLREAYDISREYAALGWYWVRYRISPFVE